MNDRSRTHRSVRLTLSFILFLGTLVLVSATSRDYGVTWDEPPYFIASDLHTNWIKRFVEQSGHREWVALFDDNEIQAAWRWNPYHVPHPPFSRIVSGLLKTAATPALDDLTAYRLGPAVFFALLVTIMFQWIGGLFGIGAGLFSALALVGIPNLFGYAHFAITDMPLVTLWFATYYCFYKGVFDWRWSIASGVVWGLAISTKFPALLAFIPLILWAHLFYRERYDNNVLAMLFLAPIVMIATQPYLWHQTGLRGLEFLYEGLSRGYRPETNFGVFFAGEVIFSQQLPWYYPFLLISVTTPEVILITALLGTLLVSKKEYRSTVVLFLFGVAFIPLLGVMPGAVLHDGVRQILAALPFLAGLAGMGFHVIASRLYALAQRRDPQGGIARLREKIYVTLFVALSFPPALDVYLTHPYQLSFYNRLTGGVSGAFHKGWEITYFLEALTPTFLLQLNEKLPPKAIVHGVFTNSTLAYYQEKRFLRQDIRITDNAPYEFLILLNRRSALSPGQRALIESTVKPFLSVHLAGVPLIATYDLRTLPKS